MSRSTLASARPLERITSDARGHRGDALLVSHERQHHQQLTARDMSMPAACATNTDAAAPIERGARPRLNE